MMKEMIMLCERIDPFFVIVVLFGVAWFAVVLGGLVYGLRNSRATSR